MKMRPHIYTIGKSKYVSLMRSARMKEIKNFERTLRKSGKRVRVVKQGSEYVLVRKITPRDPSWIKGFSE